MSVSIRLIRIFQIERHIVRRHHAIGERSGNNFGLGARQQAVIELARRFHRACRDGAVMTRDEVHQAEIEYG